MRQPLGAVAGILLLCGCKAKPQAHPDAAVSPIADAAVSTLSDAGVTPKVARSDAGARPYGIFPARVIVSSRVDNETEKPEALLDFDPDTAWSSRTGDLALP